jgi:hypothetical protein
MVRFDVFCRVWYTVGQVFKEDLYGLLIFEIKFVFVVCLYVAFRLNSDDTANLIKFLLSSYQS